MTDQVEITEAQTLLTEEEIVQLENEDDRWFEVIDGELVEVDREAVTYLHVIIIDNLFRILDGFVRGNKLGRVQTDGLRFILKRDGKRVVKRRVPDFTFVRRGRFTKNFDWNKNFEGAPDLAVEVHSPEQTLGRIAKTVADYFEAGTEEVWILYQNRKTLHRYRQSEPEVEIYTENDVLESPLFPGLKIAIRDVFAVEEDEE